MGEIGNKIAEIGRMFIKIFKTRLASFGRKFQTGHYYKGGKGLWKTE